MIEVEDARTALATKEEWDQEFQEQLDHAKSLVEGGRLQCMTWILIQKDWVTGEVFNRPQNFIAITHFDGPESKNRYFTLMRAIAMLSDAIAAVFFTEAWAAPSAEVAPSEHPDRREMVVVLGTHRTFGSVGASALVLAEGKTVEDPVPDDTDQSPRTVGEWLIHEPSFAAGFGKVVFTDEERTTMDLDDTFYSACRAYVEMNTANLQELERAEASLGAPA